MSVSDADIAIFQTEGIAVLRGVFREWLESLAEGVDTIMRDPSPLERSYRPTDGSAAFFQDYCNWTRIEAFRTFVFESPAAEIAAQLMRSHTARFFHDHVLVKHPGNSTVTPWHQDQPFYCVEGRQSVSFWTPLDPISRAVSLECVAGSHRWGAANYRPRRFDGTPLYPGDGAEEVPDIAAEREHLSIRAWDLEPGDAIAFDFRTIHGAPANASSIPRRVVSTRWVGEDARFVRRSNPGSPPFAHLTLDDGAPLEGPDFPVVHPRNAASARQPTDSAAESVGGPQLQPSLIRSSASGEASHGVR